MGIPAIQISGLEKKNKVKVDFDYKMNVQQAEFEIKSVVCVKTSKVFSDLIIGNYTILNDNKRENESQTYIYDPINVLPQDEIGLKNNPISYINLHDNDVNDSGSFMTRG